MNLPFTQAQFFEIFAAYNETVWPLQLALNAAAIAMVGVLFWTPDRAGRVVSLGLAMLWTWLALGYHLAFFWKINPGAPFFAAISLAAAIAFLWFGVFRSFLQFRSGVDARKIAGLIVVMFALAGYPAIGALTGHHYPATPTFGLPCPTTIYTFGVLLMAARPVPGWVLPAPMLWSAIGAVAAFKLGVTQDLALLVMLLLGMYMLMFTRPRAGDSHQAD
jgi:hypothetical protein